MLPKYEGSTGYVRALDDRVVGGADAVKFAMDRFGDEFKVWFNDTFLPSLLATTAGASGADNIGTTPILEGADTVQKALAALLTQVQSAALGQLPDGTITDAKLSNAPGQIKDRVASHLNAESTEAHIPKNVGLDKVDNKKQMPIDGGTFTGIAKAQNNTSYTTAQLRNVIISTENPSGGSNGDIWIKYA